MLDLDKTKMIKKRIKIDIKLLMPDLFTNQASYLAKQGEKITYYFPELDEVKP